jgi:26S proteasome regulatory subunit N1
MALILGRHRSQFVSDDEELNALIGNHMLSENFVAVAREMDLLEPKIPEVCNVASYT